MRHLLMAILVDSVLVLIFMLHSQSVAIKALQATVAAPPAPSLELQGRCAKQAAEVFKQEGYGTEPLADFTNHYSGKMGRCFVVISNTKVTGNVSSADKSLSDAFEGKVYGSYTWINSQGKKYWEVAPSVCTVTLPSGEEKKCQSSEEWDELVKAYTEMM
jgi:subtilisin family serine protease